MKNEKMVNSIPPPCFLGSKRLYRLLCVLFCTFFAFALVGCGDAYTDEDDYNTPQEQPQPTLQQQKLESLNNTTYCISYNSDYSQFIILNITTAFSNNASTITLTSEKLLPHKEPSVIERITISFTNLDEFFNVCGVAYDDQYKFKQNANTIELTKNNTTKTYSRVTLKRIKAVDVSYSTKITNADIINEFNNSYYEVLKSYSYFPNVMPLTSGQQNHKVYIAYMCWHTQNPWSKLAVYKLGTKTVYYSDYNFLFDNLPISYDNADNDIVVYFNSLLEAFPEYIDYEMLTIQGGTYNYYIESNFAITCQLDVVIEDFIH